MVAKEPDADEKGKHQKILNGLHFSLVGLAIFIGLIVRAKFFMGK
jgi:hypothetical protein